MSTKSDFDPVKKNWIDLDFVGQLQANCLSLVEPQLNHITPYLSKLDTIVCIRSGGQNEFGFVKEATDR